MHLQENRLFDLGVKVTQNVAQYLLHYVTYAATQFEVVRSNDTFTRHMTDTKMDRQATNQHEIKSGYNVRSNE